MPAPPTAHPTPSTSHVSSTGSFRARPCIPRSVRARPPAHRSLTRHRIFHRIPLHVQRRPSARRRRAQLCTRRADTHRHPPTALPVVGVRFREVRRHPDARQRKGVHADIATTLTTDAPCRNPRMVSYGIYLASTPSSWRSPSILPSSRCSCTSSSAPRCVANLRTAFPGPTQPRPPLAASMAAVHPPSPSASLASSPSHHARVWQGSPPPRSLVRPSPWVSGHSSHRRDNTG